MTLSRCPSDLMARSLQPLDANICVAKACASAHQPSSSAASEATAERLVVSRGTDGVSDYVMFLVPAPSGLAGGQNQQEKAAFERCQRSTAQQQRHYRYGRDFYLDQMLFRAETTLSAGSWESTRGSLGPSYRLLSIESSERIEWRQFGEARAFARSLCLESKEDWVEWSQMSRERPRDIPADPCLVYGGKGGQWQGWPDFLGHEYDGSGSHIRGRWLHLEEARDYARSLGFKSQKEWHEWRKSGERPSDIPSDPDQIYKDEGWLSWGDFLGFHEGNVAGDWRPFEEARDYARSLGFKSQKEWKEWSKSGQRPPDIPARPDQVYKDEGWKSWGDFLGFNEGYVAGKWRPFDEARDYVRSLGLKSQKKWKERSKSGERPPDIPSHPNEAYEEEGWLSWGDFLGYNPGHIAEKRSTTKKRPFAEARDYVRSFGLKSHKEWEEWSKSGKRPPDILSHPDRVYKGKGWLSWGDFLGFNPGNVAKEWRSFEEARDFARSLGLKSQKEWQEWSKSGKRPQDIPFNPHTVYKGKGWMGYRDFLGWGMSHVPGLKVAQQL